MALLSENQGQNIEVPRDEEKHLREELKKRNDVETERLNRYLDMPDLSRTSGNPIFELAQRIVGLDYFKGFDVIDVPEIVNTDISFDLFNFAPDHPARSKSDTYFVDDTHILRTHTTVMWYYYLTSDLIKQRMAEGKAFGVFCYGKVYRKDEIDRNHMNIFHQMDGLYLAPRSQKEITRPDLEEALAQIARGIFGPDVEFRFNEDNFPYTTPSLEMEVKIGDRWIEVLGSGIAHPTVLEKLGVDPKQYTGWAFGFGLERLAIISMDLPDIRLLWSKDPRVQKQLKLGQKFVEVSKYPPIVRDISFVVNNDFIPNNYFDLIRDIGGDLVEEVALIDKYEDAAKFGSDKVSYTYRITYRSTDRTLRSEEIDPIQKKIYDQTAAVFKADLR
ncbi:MAG: hypothetical protein KW806_00410 [Candidatus Yanofskybacteria bacterium]|nr:hypothetical protein [Candidatus Yanofskybacteria bacterium]